MKEFNIELEYKVKKIVQKLKEAELRGNHCKATIAVLDYYNSWCINEIDAYLKSQNCKYMKDISNKEYVIYNMIELSEVI